MVGCMREVILGLSCKEQWVFWVRGLAMLLKEGDGLGLLVCAVSVLQERMQREHLSLAKGSIAGTGPPSEYVCSVLALFIILPNLPGVSSNRSRLRQCLQRLSFIYSPLFARTPIILSPQGSEILATVHPVKMARMVTLARRLIAWQFEACYHPVGPRPHRCTGQVATLTGILSQRQYRSLWGSSEAWSLLIENFTQYPAWMDLKYSPALAIFASFSGGLTSGWKK